MRMNRMIGSMLALLSMAAATDVVARDLTFAVNNIYIGTFGLEPANNDYKVTLRLHQNIFEQLTKRKFNANGKGNAVDRAVARHGLAMDRRTDLGSRPA